MTLKDELIEGLSAPPPPQPVTATNVPALDGRLFAKTLSAREGMAFSEQAPENDNHAVNVQLIRRTICDQDGELLFNGEADIPSENGVLWNRMLQAAQVANGIGPEIDRETEKNLPETGADSDAT